MIRNTSLNAIELQTILTEIEATLDSHPLSYLYTDINDGPPLTPSHFLCGHRLLTLPDTEEDSNYIPEDIGQNAYCSRDIYFQFVDLPLSHVSLRESLSHWLPGTHNDAH